MAAASILSKKFCIPCAPGAPPMRGATIEMMLQKLDGGWRVEQEHHITKEYSFQDFRSALQFVNLLAEISERENHHPHIELSWGSVTIKIWTEKIDGLTESDFILGAKCDELFDSYSKRH